MIRSNQSALRHAVRAALATLIITPVAALAGEFDSVSEDSMLISVQKNAKVQVSQVDDINFGELSSTGAGGLSETDEVCIFSNTGTYALTLTSGTGGTEGFSLTNGVARLPYAVTVTESADDGVLGGALGGVLGDGSQEAQSSTEITGLQSSSDQNCSGGENVGLTIAIAENDFGAAPAGDYSDTLAVYVRPE